ncbi:4Fe-4S binding protein [Clostridioides difficile]|nr:4Fe-4S binding protein [Clostridioides difficile]
MGRLLCLIKKKYANILANECVACGSCIKACPRSAISVPCGISAKLIEIYVLDGICEKICPASVIEIITILKEEEGKCHE